LHVKKTRAVKKNFFLEGSHGGMQNGHLGVEGRFEGLRCEKSKFRSYKIFFSVFFTFKKNDMICRIIQKKVKKNIKIQQLMFFGALLRFGGRYVVFSLHGG